MRKKGLITIIILSITLLSTTVFAEEKNSIINENVAKKEINEYISEQYSELSDSERKALADDIYLEKYNTYLVNTLSTENTNDDISDIAYENMMEQEKYIVKLINEHNSEKTSIDNWEYNLNYLKTNYDEIITLKDINRVYVDLYIEDYEIVESLKTEPKSNINGIRTYSTTYKFADAVKYAKKYYEDYNSEYPNWKSYGGDCANFISQCLYAGGKSMKGTPGTTSAADNKSNWFSKGKSCNTKNVSATWRSANAFREYWSKKASSSKKFKSVGADSYKYGFSGDAISLLNKNGRAYHTLIIVGYDVINKDFVVATHTSNTKTAKLSSYSATGGFIIYNMR